MGRMGKGVKMNKEILFRGKRVDNDEWTFGDLIVSKNKYYIHPQGNSFQVDGVLSRLIVLHEVKSETVGQYTGLTDKNGKKIFEGNVISATALDTGKEQRAVVCFGNFIDENNDDEYIGFFIEFDGIKTTITQLSMEECKNRIEVIGNKYDNKELLR